MARARGALLVVFALVALTSAAETDEATCPPARFIACGDEPAAKTCLSYVVSATTGARRCCWVVDENGVPSDAWVTDFVADAGGDVAFEPHEFGVQDAGPIMTAEFDLRTRVMSALLCYYYVTDKCAPGALDGMRALTLRAADPTRFRVTEAVERHTVRETTANPAENVCACDHLDALPLPERYRCCYWDSRMPSDQPEPAPVRWTDCYAPRASAESAADCRRITRPVAQCGDAGACFCRFEYNTLAPAATRDPWACGLCCPRLTDDFGRDQIAKNNNTRGQCLSDVYPFSPPDDGTCGHERLARTAAPVASGASRLGAFWRWW